MEKTFQNDPTRKNFLLMRKRKKKYKQMHRFWLFTKEQEEKRFCFAKCVSQFFRQTAFALCWLGLRYHTIYDYCDTVGSYVNYSLMHAKMTRRYRFFFISYRSTLQMNELTIHECIKTFKSNMICGCDNLNKANVRSNEKR